MWQNIFGVMNMTWGWGWGCKMDHVSSMGVKMKRRFQKRVWQAVI